VQNLRNAGAEVIAAYTLPQQAGSVMRTAREQLNWDAPIIFSGVIADPITIALAGPENAQGVITVAYLHPLTATDVPGVQQHIEIMDQYSDLDASNLSLYGQSVAELTVAVLEAAGPELNRRSIIAAAESIRDFTCSVCLGPINLSATDHRPIETFQFAMAEGELWVPFGDLISYETTAD
jgi:hypothetical protein